MRMTDWELNATFVWRFGGLVWGGAMETGGAFWLSFGEAVCDWLEAGVVFGWQSIGKFYGFAEILRGF